MLTAVGCGGAKKNPTDAYRASTTSLCKAEEKEVNSIAQPRSASEVRGYLREILPVVQKRIGELQKLEPPPDFREDHQRLVDLNKNGAAAIAAAITKLDTGADPSVVAADLAKLDTLDKTETDIWTRLGVEECASGFE